MLSFITSPAFKEISVLEMERTIKWGAWDSRISSGIVLGKNIESIHLGKLRLVGSKVK